MEKLIFSKYSNERARRFAIRTDIVSDEMKQLKVYKRNLYPEGKQHIKDIYQWYKALSDTYQDTQIELNRCEFLEDKVSLEFLTQLTLEHQLNELLREKKIEQFSDLLFSYIDEVKKGDMVHPFTKTEGFINTFGDVEIGEALSAKVTNIDMVLNNVILGEKWTIIDYEWTFDFPIPSNFVIYRIIHYFINSSPFQEALAHIDLFEQAKITLTEQETYAEMEKHFQTKFLLSDANQVETVVPIRELHEDISPGGIDLKRMFNDERMRRETPIQLFMSEVYDFSEENSKILLCNIDEKIELDVELSPETDFLRFDPHELSCSLTELEIRDEQGQEIPVLNTNGIFISEHQLIFLDDDPQIILSNLKDTARLKISYKIKLTTEEEREIVVTVLNEKNAFEEITLDLQQQQQQLKAEIEQQQQQLQENSIKIEYQSQLISNMENTKIWKAYEKYKKTLGKS